MHPVYILKYRKTRDVVVSRLFSEKIVKYNSVCVDERKENLRLNMSIRKMACNLLSYKRKDVTISSAINPFVAID